MVMIEGRWWEFCISFKREYNFNFVNYYDGYESRLKVDNENTIPDTHSLTASLC